jgi:phage host-nuclease inhibitor protein Gam
MIMGIRYKPDAAGKLESVDDVNMALRDIGLAEREIETINTVLTKETAKLKSEAEKNADPFRKQITDLSTRIQAYAEYNKTDLFKDKKTMDLSFGSFGYRKSTKISVKKTTLELMKKLKLTKFIRVKEEPDKDKMAELSDESLSQVDACRKSTDDFFCEAKTESVSQDAAQTA